MALRDTIKNHKAATGLIAAAGVAVVAWLAFGVFGVHTLFTDNEVNEAGPVFDSATSQTTQPAASAKDAEPTTAPADPGTTDPSTAEPSAPAEQTSPPTTASGGVTTVAQGTFSGADASHDVAGTAVVLTDGSEQRFLRFEDFEATNGPDLKVYLRAANDEYVSLGDLKGNIGSQNYEIPVDVDLSTYSTVQIWCQRFAVSFGQAELA